MRLLFPTLLLFLILGYLPVQTLFVIFTPTYTLFLLLFSTTLFELLTPYLSSTASRFMAEPSGSEFYIKVKPAATAATHF